MTRPKSASSDLTWPGQTDQTEAPVPLNSRRRRQQQHRALSRPRKLHINPRTTRHWVAESDHGKLLNCMWPPAEIRTHGHQLSSVTQSCKKLRPPGWVHQSTPPLPKGLVFAAGAIFPPSPLEVPLVACGRPTISKLHETSLPQTCMFGAWPCSYDRAIINQQSVAPVGRVFGPLCRLF
jgi:hypothetical protein